MNLNQYSIAAAQPGLAVELNLESPFARTLQSRAAAYCGPHREYYRRPLTSPSSRARRQIELLKEYRTRLIADVVTGKLDVRAAMVFFVEFGMTCNDGMSGEGAGFKPAPTCEGALRRGGGRGWIPLPAGARMVAEGFQIGDDLLP